MRKARSFTVRGGVRYKATLVLSGFESMASNAMIGKKLKGYGFAHVVVRGSGRERVAYGTWQGKSTTVEMPKQVASVSEAVG